MPRPFHMKYSASVGEFEPLREPSCLSVTAKEVEVR
jgi:hypothetical protein